MGELKFEESFYKFVPFLTVNLFFMVGRKHFVWCLWCLIPYICTKESPIVQRHICVVANEKIELESFLFFPSLTK